nr:TonB-dependent receptor [uncultured Sphingomonas sp.]
MNLLLGLLLIQPASETIIITGHGLPDRRAGEAVVEVDRERLSTSPSGRMEDVVRSVSGLTSFRRSDARSTHPTAQGLTARGLGGNAASRFAVEVDGVPQVDPFGGWITFTALDPALAESVIIRRGGLGGVRFGSGAVAGSLTIDSIADPGIRVGASAGSRDSIDLWATGGQDIGRARLIGGAAFAHGDGFAPIVAGDRGPVDRAAPYRQASGRVRLLAPIGTTELQASVSGFTDKRDRGVDFTTSRGKGVDGSLRLVGRDWSATGYVQKRQFESGFASVSAGRASVSPALDQYDVPASGWGLQTLWQHRLANAQLSIGADLRGTDGTTNERYFFNAGSFRRERHAGARSLTGGLFAESDWAIGATNVGVGLRLDRWSIHNARLFERNIGGPTITDLAYPDGHGTKWSGRASVSRKLGGAMTLRGAIYRAWRLPTINELVRPFRVGPDATAANPYLTPETSLGAEVGADWSSGNQVKLSITAYANRLRNAVTNVTLAHGPGNFPGVGFVGAGGLYRQRLNVDSIQSRGLEADGEWHRGPWSLGGSLALTHARLHDNGLAIPIDGARPAQTPSVQAALRAGWADRRRLAQISLRYIGKQDEAEGDPKPLPSAFTIDAVARWQVSGRVSVDLRGENLLNKQVITSILGDGPRERATPRTLWIGLRFN